MDEVSKQRVLEQISKENLNHFKYLREKFFELKSVVKRVPTLSDFFYHGKYIDPIKFVKESKSFYEFVSKIEEKRVVDEKFLKTIRFIDSLLPVVRVYEVLSLSLLLEREALLKEDVYYEAFKFLENLTWKCRALFYLNSNF